jgi:hypothetical protein
VRVLEGDLAGADGPPPVLVDIIGMPFTPLSFAGVTRRTARRLLIRRCNRALPALRISGLSSAALCSLSLPTLTNLNMLQPGESG